MRRRRESGASVSTADRTASTVGAQRDLEAKQRHALDDLFSAAYRELRRMAASIKRADAKATISTETLVHETWMKLAHSGTLAAESRVHLKRIVAQAMRQYVIGAARRRCASKRGGSGAVFVTLNDSAELPVSCDYDLLALDSALEDLMRMNPRSASLIELRFFGGLEVAEAAGLLGIAESTALRDWRSAKAWLASQIRRGQ